MTAITLVGIGDKIGIRGDTRLFLYFFPFSPFMLELSGLVSFTRGCGRLLFGF